MGWFFLSILWSSGCLPVYDTSIIHYYRNRRKKIWENFKKDLELWVGQVRVRNILSSIHTLWQRERTRSSSEFLYSGNSLNLGEARICSSYNS